MRSCGILINENQILLIHRIKNEIEYYVVPGGTVEQGETAEAACIREMLEETGLLTRIIKPLIHPQINVAEESYFYVERIGGVLQLGGPELERTSPDNQYLLEWLPLASIENIDLRPDKLKMVLKV